MFAPVVVAAVLAAQGVPAPLRPAHVSVVTVAAVGVGLMVTGLAVGVAARVEGGPSPFVSTWSEALRARIAGSVGLLGAGFALFSLAALVGQHRLAGLSAWLTPVAGAVRWELRW